MLLRIAAALICTLLCASPASATAIYLAPASVQADGNGAFSFTVTLIAGEGCVGWTGYGYGGETNVRGGFYADTFCIDPQPIEPGTEFSFEVLGELTDPTQPGSVWSESGFCTGGGGQRVTVVLAPSVPTDHDTWSTLKARYR